FPASSRRVPRFLHIRAAANCCISENVDPVVAYATWIRRTEEWQAAGRSRLQGVAASSACLPLLRCTRRATDTNRRAAHRLRGSARPHAEAEQHSTVWQQT